MSNLNERHVVFSVNCEFIIVVSLITLYISAAMCPGRNFPAKYVVHVNSPSWGSSNSQQQLEKAVKNILTLADEKNLKSLAIPSIGSGK